jgi:PAS domain S-box-containing protein
MTENMQVEPALRKSDEKLRLLVQCVREYAILMLDTEGRVVTWTEGAERIKGYCAKEIIGRHFSTFHTPEAVAQDKPNQELKLATEHGRFEGEGWRVRKDGSWFWANVVITALRDDRGKLHGFGKVTRDLTEQKEAEEKLQKAGALQSAIFNSANFSSIATDAKGVIQIFNVGAERMLGYLAADVMNKLTPADISDPQELIARSAALSLELDTPIASGFEALVFKASRGIEDIYELTYIRKDGSRFPAVVSVTALRDAQNAIIGYLLIGTDNSARKQAEEEAGEALRETDALLRTIHLHSIVSVADRAGRIIDVNDSFCAISGYSRGELLGKTHNIVNSGFHSDDFWTAMWGNIASGKSWRGDICNRSKQGSLYWVDSIIVPFLGEDGQTTKFISIRTDITAAKLSEGQLRLATQKAEHANRAKSEFLANMSHEIRTPMNAIMGMTYLAQRADPTPVQRGYLTTIANASQSLLNIINDILDFSKIEAGKLQLERIPFSPSALLNKVHEIVAYVARQKSIGLVFTVGPGVPSSLIGDPLRLEQILINLVNNAIKFSDQGEVLLTVSAEDPGQFSFSVRDSGIGMSPEQIGQLFQSFNQADTSITRKYGGTGLGLAITKQLCELMEGTLAVESELGEGSTFLFTAPFSVDTETRHSAVRADLGEPNAEGIRDPLMTDMLLGSAEQAPSASEWAQAPKHDLASLKGRRVLLVEDNHINRLVATELLGDLGILVSTAVNGREGVDRIASEPFDLVLMDIQMPVMDGLTATRLVRADEQFSRLPIIAMTAHAMSGSRERSLEAGMCDHLTKPINPTSLAASLMRWMPAEPLSIEEKSKVLAEQIPDLLLPFDIPVALANTNGKPALLREILFSFRDQYASAVPDLIRLLEEGRPGEAERLAHSLKSVAATVGARDLTEAALNLEEALRARRSEGVAALIDALQCALAPAIAAVRSMGTPPGVVLRVEEAQPQEATVTDHHPCVLLVDDEATTIALLCDTFRGDYRILVASDGQAALELASPRKPDVILLDVKMAGMDGFEVCRRLKEDGKTRDIPIIFLTGAGDRAAETRGLKLGAVDYVTKPISPAAVKARVDNQIALKRAQDSKAVLAAKELAITYARFNSVLESMSDGVLTISRQWILLYANGKAKTSLPDLKIGADYWSCFPALRGTPAERHQRDAMEMRFEVQYEVFYPPYEQWYRGRAFPVDEGLSIFFTNITLEKKIADQLALEQMLRGRRIEALGQMAGGLAHEINNPLAIIHGTARDLQRLASEPGTIAAEEIMRASETIVDTSERAIRILEGLRGFAGDDGKDLLELASVYNIVEQSVEMQEARFLLNDVELRTEVATQIPLLMCRETQIGQILTNLLNNAFDAIVQQASTERWVTLEASCVGESVRIDVTNSGVGLEDGASARPMGLLVASDTHGSEIGVGLTLSRAVASEHGGLLALLQGTEHTCFRLTLPMAGIATM